ncbi:MAG: hypothetical protein AAF891_06855 [Pseudomonadota bacterium]
MNTPLSIALAVLIIGGISADLIMTGGDNLLFLARKFTDFTAWLAFWR